MKDSQHFVVFVFASILDNVDSIAVGDVQIGAGFQQHLNDVLTAVAVGVP